MPQRASMKTKRAAHPGTAGRRPLPQVTDRLPIGRTGLSVSPICLGCVEDPDTISVAFDLGINFFFLTADMHWPVYDTARRGLCDLLNRRRGVRDNIVVAVASYVTQPEFTYLPFAELLQAVPLLERLDIVVIGGAYGAEFAVRQKLYLEHVRRGEFGARAVGATFHDREAAVVAINEDQVDLAFIRYNPAHPSARTDVFPRLQPSSTKIFNFKSMIGYTKPRDLRKLGVSTHHWQPTPTDYYRFALSQPAIDGLLCSLEHPREVRALRLALRSPPLDEQEQRYLIDLANLSAGRVRIADHGPQRRSKSE
jgi:hypothetical protein